MMRFRALLIALLAVLATAPPAVASSVFYIRGAGNGHGIGMSQYGAYGYALHGQDYRSILAHYYQGTSLGATDPAQIVRVLLGTGSAAFAGANRAGGQKLNPSVTYTVHALADGSLTLTDPSGKKVGNGFAAPLVVTGTGPLGLAGLGAYHGSFEFRPDGRGGVQSVDAVGLDDYVRGVIAAEMPSSWAAEALKVQAVAARTYAITDSVGGNGYDLYSDTRSQMYRGISAQTQATDAAVAATSGQVVTYHGAPAVTYFAASSGGHTENIEDAWPGTAPKPWLRGVPDPYDSAAKNPYFRWGYQLSASTAARKLGRLVRGRFIGIQVTRHGVSPRIVQARVVGTGGRTTVTGGQLEGAFGLPSTWASFTTITAQAGPGAAADVPHAAQEAQAVVALVSLVHQMVAGGVPTVQGSVFPAARGAAITLQVKGGRGWRTLSKHKLGAGGGFRLKVPGRGTYRIVYRGLNGPAVSVR